MIRSRFIMSVCGVFCALMVSRASDAQITITDSGQVNKYSLSLEGLKADRSAETGRALAMLEKLRREGPSDVVFGTEVLTPEAV